MTVHAFVDETKRHGLLLAVAVVAPRDLADTRALMRSLCMPRQARIHFNHERDSRRSRIVTAINSTNVNVDIYDGAAIRDQRKARAACLHQVVVDLARVGGPPADHRAGRFRASGRHPRPVHRPPRSRRR